MKQAFIEGLGACEHCGAIVCIEDFPMDSMDAKWSCKGCSGELTQDSFGYETVDGKPKKTKWVGPDGKLTKEKPKTHFDLGNLSVVVRFKPPATLPISRY